MASGTDVLHLGSLRSSSVLVRRGRHTWNFVQTYKTLLLFRILFGGVVVEIVSRAS